MAYRWLSYLPYHVAQDILQHPDQSPLQRENRFDAVALFADVSGFTALSEALAAAGKAGTEELTAILNSYFAPMIDLIQSYGGIIGKFGGDALTVLFPYTADTVHATVRRAVQCALDMQAAMPRYQPLTTQMVTSAGEHNLYMKAGLAMGSVLNTSIGDPALRLEYIIAGKLLDDCADAEHHASKGEVVIHDALLAYLEDVHIVERRGGFTCVSGLTQPAERAPLTAPLPEFAAVPESARKTFLAYLHPSIAHRLENAPVGFINEHRRVTVLFVRFSGFDYDHDRDVTRKLQAYFEQVVRIIGRYGGYLNKIDMGDKGSKYIVLFGVPVAHEDDEERALRCALEISQLRVPAAVGVNTGMVYCGQVGSEKRQEYTVMGDGVNLAARLMQIAAERQIIVSEFTRRLTMEKFHWIQLEPVKLKGKSALVTIYAIEDVRESPAARLSEPIYRLPMVGRENELLRVREQIRQTLDGRGQIVAVSGDAGVGKSRLTVEIIRLASALGLLVYTGECQSFGTNSSFLVWRKVWGALLNIDPSASPSVQAEQVAAAIDPQFALRLPLLNVLLNLSIPDNAVTEMLDAKLRMELLHNMLLDILRLYSRNAPLLMVLEDCHWIDPLSLDLLSFLGRGIIDMPVMILMVHRPTPGEPNLDGLFEGLAHFHALPLREFGAEEAQQLIQLKLEQLYDEPEQFPAELGERIMTLAQGNPFYIEEIFNYLFERGIDPNDSRAQTLDLPDSLNSLILSRIDQLAEDEKTTLKLASVLGRTFRANWLWGAYPTIGQAQDVQRRLEALSAHEMILLQQSEPELAYLFKHILTREIAYESLAIATREGLHEQMARFIEEQFAAQLDHYLDILAFHYGSSRNQNKQREYFLRAGDRAKTRYANESAIAYYERLLPLLPPAERGETQRKLGEVWQLVGKWKEAESAYQDALALAAAAKDARAQAYCELALGQLRAQTAAPVEALALLERAQKVFENLRDQHGLSQTLQHVAVIHLQQGNYEQALAAHEQQLTLTRGIGDLRGTVETYLGLGWVYTEQGDIDAALENLHEALEIATDINYQRGIIQAYNDIAGTYFVMGGLLKALDSLQRALETAAKIGYIQVIGIVASNSGEVYRLFGFPDQALACYQKALQIALELGDQISMVYSVANIANLFQHTQPEQAQRLYADSIRLGGRVEATYMLCEMHYGLAQIAYRERRFAAARAANQQALEIAEQVGRREIALNAEILNAQIDHETRAADQASVQTRLQTLTETYNQPSELAAIWYTMWQLDGAQTAAREDAAAYYRELGQQASTQDRARYAALTGDDLPPPPALPPLQPIVTDNVPPLDVLLEAFRTFVDGA